MNEMSIEKEEQIEKLRLALIENYQYTQRLEQIENINDEGIKGIYII